MRFGKPQRKLPPKLLTGYWERCSPVEFVHFWELGGAEQREHRQGRRHLGSFSDSDLVPQYFWEPPSSVKTPENISLLSPKLCQGLGCCQAAGNSIMCLLPERWDCLDHTRGEEVCELTSQCLVLLQKNLFSVKTCKIVYILIANIFPFLLWKYHRYSLH